MDGLIMVHVLVVASSEKRLAEGKNVCHSRLGIEIKPENEIQLDVPEEFLTKQTLPCDLRV